MTRLLALTGLPGAGVTTVTRLLCTEFGAMAMSMAAYPRLRLEAQAGLQFAGEEALAEYRMRRERMDKLVWIRPFHRRLMRLIRQTRPSRLVITGILTEAELAYCGMLGARLVHLTAPAEIRRQRLRFESAAITAYESLDRLAQAQPHLWDLIIDSDEPYPEFIRSVRAQLAQL
jgi:dephospho-CoA kinase